MRHLRFLTIAFLLAGALPLQAQKVMPPTKAELDAVTARGRQLAAYDTAASFGTDAVIALKPDPKTAPFYLARQTEKGWTVAFGRLDEANARFLIYYEAVQKDPRNPKEFDAHTVNPPRADTGFFLNASRAIALGRKTFTLPAERPYNVAVLPASEGQFWVYLYPAQTQEEIWPLGGDMRLLVSKDGTKVVSQRRLHKSILDMAFPKNQRIAAGTHNAVLADLPEDTDVFYVLSRKPSLPEVIGTPHFTYQVETDGSIHRIERGNP